MESERQPSGAVTFLFTDIEGSTRLVKQLRDRYHGVLAEHQELLRSAFSTHRGYEVDTQGDAFFVAFSMARDAVLAAAEGQLALLSYPWPEGVELKVRMGVHTGQAAERNGKYTGLAVHRAARICAAGHGGQILVSQATHTLLEDEEENLDISFSDLGEHQLKDLDRPVRLYQVGAEGLPAHFPPVRSADLPAEAASSAASSSLRQRATLAAAAVGLLAVLAAAAAFLLTRNGGSSVVLPNHVGVIDPETNTVIGSVPVGTGPGPIATGAGSLWVGNAVDRTITRISLGRRVPAATISLDGRTPTGIDFGGSGLWVAHGARGEASRIDPRSNRLRTTIQIADPGSNNGGVAVDGGSVWAVYGDSTLARIDAKNGHREGATFAGDSPRGLVVANGFIWVLNAGDRTVTRFARRSYEGGPVGRPIRVGRRPAAIAAGAGAIWVADEGDNAVTRIDPLTNATSTIRVGRQPSALAFGGGLVWVANGGSGTVSRIDPVSNELVGTIKVGDVPSGVAFDGNFVWVAVDGAS